MIQKLRDTIARVASTDLALLILGENGTGKEVVSRMVHYLSDRRDEPFIAVNCAAIPENLLESELFGHEKGAFTGANTERIGKFEQCYGGTIFLDEIGDMTLPTQTKILRVLQDGIFDRVGGNASVKVDVRLLAATNTPLEKALEQNDFREDLFYRLNVVRVALPPLRNRNEDIPLLVDYFLQKFTENDPPAVQSEAMTLLKSHSWPGNVRELEMPSAVRW